MLVRLMRCDDPAEVLGKNKTVIRDIDGVWKEDTSWLEPVVIVNTTDVSNVNYMFIPKFNRYYFVKNITALTGGRIQITGLVDALDSWETEIRQQSVIVARQENRWNLYLNDPNYNIYANPWIKQLEFPKGFNKYELVMAVAGSPGGD